MLFRFFLLIVPQHAAKDVKELSDLFFALKESMDWVLSLYQNILVAVLPL